jgi:site-specific DNA-methyltransferase (adenine-specific)
MKPDLTRSFNMDCMEFMKDVPDKFYELGVIDPPYGIGIDGFKTTNSNNTKGSFYKKKGWDKKSSDKLFFDQLFRVTKNQIIFGANHFISKIPYDSSCWIVWDKNRGDQCFADAELAWTSFDSPVKLKKITWDGFRQDDMKNKQVRIHPTEKPVKLYEWLLMNYAKEGDKILDTHGGSQSSRIACYNLGYALDIIELDQEYFDEGNKRFETHKQQLTLF